MAYLGRGLDKISNIEVLDNITFDGSSSYSITKGSVAFTPNSAQSCLISIDGVVQATNFTVNGSTIDFGVAIPSTSTCNFFLHYGTGVMTVPSDGSVTTAKLGDGSVTSAKLDSGVALGKVLQVVTATDSTERSTTSSTFVTASNALTVSITPSATSSKIFVTSSFSGGNLISGEVGYFTIFRDSTNLGGANGLVILYSGTTAHKITPTAMSILDSPSSTSTLNYQVYVRGRNSSQTRINDQGSVTGTITAFEIGA